MLDTLAGRLKRVELFDIPASLLLIYGIPQHL